MFFRTVAASLLALFLAAPPVAADVAAPKSGNAVFDRAVALVDEHFYSGAALPAFHAAVAGYLADLAKRKPAAFPGDAVEEVLPSLKASHTGRFLKPHLRA